MPNGFRVIAHRGASAHAPENTLPAFESAVAQGAREVELDVRFSADEEIIVFHDDTLDRKTNHGGRVRHHTAATLRRVDVGSWFDRRHPDGDRIFAGTPVVSLDQVLGALGGSVHYHIEIKGFEDWLPLRVLQEVDKYGVTVQATVTSFSMRPLVQMRKLREDLPLCFLLRDAVDAVRTAEFRPELERKEPAAVQAYWIAAAAAEGFQQVGVRACEVTRDTVALAREHGLGVRGWGVRDEADLERLVRLGAIGATVDWPGRALELVDRWTRPVQADPVETTSIQG